MLQGVRVSKQPFVHLHFHTQYSLLDGACRVKSAMETAQAQGMSAVAITDHGVLYGAVDFYKTAKSYGVKPILGCEVYTTPENTGMTERKTGRDGSQSNHLVLLAENEVGYQNLVQLVSRAHLDGFYYKPRIDKALLREYNEGLIGLSACLKGEIPEHCVRGDVDGAVQKTEEFTDILGKDNFYIELQDHGIQEQRIANEGLLEVAKRTGLPLVATNDVHYIAPEHHTAHDVMICLQTQSVMSDPNRMKYQSDQFYMKTPEEMWDLFREYPDALKNTLAIAERCNVELQLDKEFHFPLYQLPEGENQKHYLAQVAKEGLKYRYGVEDVDHPKNEEEKKIADRFYHELNVIEKTGFINYFLVVWDFVRFARERHIPVGPGRGSGAGSIMAYVLGITGIDPLQYDLIFERFLNPDRVSPPDFDIDFCQSRRDEVIDYVKEKYGRDSVAQIITFGTLGAKTVIRDVGRVLEIPFNECDRLAKLIPEEPGMTLEKALQQSPDFKKATETEEHAKRIMQHARVLEGLPRNPGTHAAGVVIGEKPLVEILPLARDKDKEVVTQFEMKPLEQTGLLKMDFLGLKTLTVIQETIDHVKKTKDIDLDMETLPMNDEPTFALLNRGDTIGVFQIESQGMRDLLRRIGLTCFEEIIAMIALFRPGPMNMLDDYVNRKHGKVKIKYDHSLLEPILKETYGVMLYQEQVQRAANVLAGYSLGEGDILRRAMGKKTMEEMTQQRDKFVKGCAQHNKINAKTAEKIFNNIERFAGYGFNKSHSAAYAILSYQTAFFKAHYPSEFMAALLSSEMGNADKLPMLIAEAQEMEIEMFPPDVNESEVRFRPVINGMRFGLAGVKNIGVGVVESIIKEREMDGPFKDGLVEFCSRLDSKANNKKVLESLVKCGAFDYTKQSRGRLFNGIEFAINRASEANKDRQSGQGSLFDILEDKSEEFRKDELPPAEPWPASQMLSAEKELLGFYISGHPLTAFEWTLTHYNLANMKELSSIEAGTSTRIGGLVSHYQKKFTKRTQEPMAIFRLAGLQGWVEVVAFPDAFREYGVYLQEDVPIMICGEISQDDRLKMIAGEMYPLERVHDHFTQNISIHLSAANLQDDRLERIKSILRRHPGNIPVTVCLQFPGGEKVFIKTDRRLKVSAREKLVHELEHCIGEDSIYVAINRSPYKHGDQERRNAKGWAKRKAG
ncbi:MAG: DNA polymerase III subunit alpha [Kiritimatiellae bacterium]|nr:DNA polymerase III subunit alpha [Kiritimatiellia bacterium]